MNDERAEFSKRLAAAMRVAGYEPRPSVLFRQFNTRFGGTSVSFQTASRWLRGESMPEQDKLVALAEWLKEGPDFLRFGGKAAHGKRGTLQVIKEEASNYDDQRLFDTYRALSVPHQSVVREVILALSAATTKWPNAPKSRSGTKPTGKS